MLFSRATIEEIRLGINFSKMAVMQQQDPETTAYRTAVTALKWEEIDVDDGWQQAFVRHVNGEPQAAGAGWDVVARFLK